MSDVSQGPGWWLASDGRWYPPDQAPGYAPPAGPTEAPAPDGSRDPTSPFDPGLGVPAPSPESDLSGTSYPTAPGHGPAAAPPGYPPPAGPGFAPPPGPPGYPPPAGSGYGTPMAPPVGPPGYPPPMDPAFGYPPGGPGYAYVPVQKTNGMAIASLVCSLVWLGGLGSILAVIFGFIARAQIKKSEGTVQGNGLAVAGIIIGFVGLVALIGLLISVAALIHHCDQTGNCTTNTYNFGN